MNSIVGMVFAPSGRPLETRVRIRLSTMTRGDRIFTTNNNGAFAFRGLPTGSYTIAIDKEADYKPFSTSIDIIQLRGSPAQTQTLNIRLEFKDRGEVKPAVVNAEFLNVPKKALAYYKTAMGHIEKRDRAGAIDNLKLAITEYPSFTAAFNELGVLYLKMNRLEEADQTFQSALKIDPESFPANVNRGITNVMMKRYGEAVPILRKAIKKEDKSAVAHYFLGQAMANLGLFNEAEKELQTALKLGGTEMKEAHRILAIIYSSRGAKKEAADELEAYLKVAPDTPDAEKLQAMIRQLREPND
ncbi:MAG TPA: tetratricopeptide repeat protein [Pyrinomonadaceae bacterium]|nr:tetratricopeptide repeat protein [Pyrinomonadaceae bacterium]